MIAEEEEDSLSILATNFSNKLSLSSGTECRRNKKAVIKLAQWALLVILVRHTYYLLAAPHQKLPRKIRISSVKLYRGDTAAW